MTVGTNPGRWDIGSPLGGGSGGGAMAEQVRLTLVEHGPKLPHYISVHDEMKRSPAGKTDMRWTRSVMAMEMDIEIPI